MPRSTRRKGTAMALPARTPGPKPRFNETLLAILGSFLIAIVLASIFVANPLRAVRLAYLDYGHTPAGGAAKSSPAVTPQTEAGPVPPAQPGAAQPGTTQPGPAATK